MTILLWQLLITATIFSIIWHFQILKLYKTDYKKVVVKFYLFRIKIT